MNYLWIILGIIGFIIIFILFKTVLKAFFKLFFFVSLTLLIVGGVFGYLVYRDVNDFKSNFPVSNNIFFLEDNGRLLTGFVMLNGGENTLPLNEQQIAEHSGYYSNKEYEKMLGNNYKMFIVKLGAFSQEGSVDYNGQSIEKRLMINALRSDNPLDTYIDGLPANIGLLNLDREQIRQAVGISDDELKLSFFALLFTDEYANNPLNMIVEYKNGNVIVYPETMMFKVIKRVPGSVIDSAGLLNEKLYKQQTTGMMIWLGEQ